MFLTKLAFKNLVRHRSRTLITASIIAFAVFFYLLLDSLILGMTDMSYESIIDYQAGHLQIANQVYWEEKDDLPLRNLIDPDNAMISAISSIDGYKAYSPEVNFKAILNNGRNELPVLGKGIDPEKYLQVFNLGDKFVEGRMCKNGEHKAVIGKRLADLMKVGINDYIILLVKDKNETFNTIEVEICGLVHSSNPNVNKNLVLLPLDIVQKSLHIDNQISKIIVSLSNKDMAKKSGHQLINTIDKSIGNNVYFWYNLEAISFAGAKNVGNQLMMMMILFIAAIAIINTVILAALERMEEIGMMKAMGLEEKEIVYTFVMESAGIGLLGGLAGVMLGLAGVWLFITYGFDWSVMTSMELSSFGIPIIGKIYGSWNITAFVNIFFFGIIVSVISSILPAHWAASKDPIKAIYHR